MVLQFIFCKNLGIIKAFFTDSQKLYVEIKYHSEPEILLKNIVVNTFN